MDPSLIGAVTGTADMYGNRPIYIRTILHTLRINKVLWCHRRLVFFVDKKKAHTAADAPARSAATGTPVVHIPPFLLY